VNAYKTTRTVRLAAGTVLALSHEQAAPRAHLLYEMEPAVYTAKEPVEFKTGETIGLMTPPAKGDSGLELIGPLEIIRGDGSEAFEPAGDIDPNNPKSSADGAMSAENPGAASTQSELKKDSAVQTQASEAEAQGNDQTVQEDGTSDNPQSASATEQATAEASKPGKKAKA
jgi:hypothetical protein